MPEDKYLELLESNRQNFTNAISQLPSIRFINFVDIREYLRSKPMDLDTANVISQISTNAPISDIDGWVRESLIQKSMVGEWIFSFNDPAYPWPHPYAHVELSQGYEWVIPLWQIGYGLYFLSLHNDYFLQVAPSEGFFVVHEWRWT